MDEHPTERKPMHESHSTAAIILAAGSSTRMGNGRHKLLLPLDNRPVLTHVIDAALASQARPIIIVLGHEAEQVLTRIPSYVEHPDIQILQNPAYLQGMSTSMRIGIEILLSNGYRKSEASGEVDSALILLGDQPLITPQIIDMLIETWHITGKRIIAPIYAGKRGNPILFAASLFPELLEITGDEGGRSVVERHRQEVEAIELSDAIANYDVDTWEAYQQVVELWQKKGYNM
jgi:molybdenum cofactor cytidylyltransferase